ncbi:MAG: urease accessory protein UreF [Gammaproteobacteria bacterium]|nr:urease accessory protein UreF [Gammaproteobacteria bacterium]
MNHGLPDVRLMQLVSPALPIGAFTYSQGLEWAVESGQVNSPEAVYNWMTGVIEDSLAYLDLPILKRLYQAFQQGNEKAVTYWSEYLLASRETSELRQEENNRGRALSTLLVDLEVAGADQYQQVMQLTQLSGFALAAVNWNIPLQQAALGYGWGLLENQVAAAIKLVPLGQTAGQKLQLQLSELLPEAVNKGLSIEDEAIGASAPAMAIASSLHETQYTRLFRS